MDIPKRKRIRLANYDYHQAGGYFITICTYEKRHILSAIENAPNTRVVLTELGEIAQRILMELPAQYGFSLDEYVIMPNHIHLLLTKDADRNEKSIGQLIGAFKSTVGNHWYKVCDAKGITAGKIWQRNYYDHIIRNQTDYIEKCKYIVENPDKWSLDELYSK